MGSGKWVLCDKLRSTWYIANLKQMAGNIQVVNGLHAHPVETREKAFQLFKKGMAHKETALLLSLPITTVIEWSRRHKWKLRVAGENAASEQVSRVTNVPIEHDNRPLLEKQSTYEDKMSGQALRLPDLMATLTDRELLMAADKIAKLDATNRKALKLESDKPGLVVNVALLAGTETKRLSAISGQVASELPVLGLVPLLADEGKIPAEQTKEIDALAIET